MDGGGDNPGNGDSKHKFTLLCILQGACTNFLIKIYCRGQAKSTSQQPLKHISSLAVTTCNFNYQTSGWWVVVVEDTVFYIINIVKSTLVRFAGRKFKLLRILLRIEYSFNI